MLKAHCSACIPKPHHHSHPCPQQHSELKKRALTNLQVVLATNLHHNLFCALFSLALDDNVMCVCQSLNRVRLFATPWTAACQSPLSREFSRQKYWSELPFPSPGDLQTQGLNTGLLHCRQILHHLSHQRSPRIIVLNRNSFQGLPWRSSG